MRTQLLRVALSLATVVPLGTLQAQTASPAPSRAFVTLGDVSGFARVPGGVFLRAANGGVLIESVTGIGVRVRIRFGAADASAFPVPRSLATGDSAHALAAAAVREAGDTIVVAAAEGLQVRATRRPLRIAVLDAAGRELVRETYGAATLNGRFTHHVHDAPGTKYVGGGEQPAGLLRNGSTYNFWNTDRFGYQPGETIYSSFPVYVGVTRGIAHALLYDNPFRGEMDFANRVPGSIGYSANGGIDGGELRYYVIPGPGFDSVLTRYTRLTGRTPLPPKWALGYQQSRYSYYPDTQVVNVATEFRRRDIPADVIHLDIHHMDEYRVFTWDAKRFPRPKHLFDSLGAAGFRMVTIVDPGVKVDTGFALYRDAMSNARFVTMPGGGPALGKVWPDTSIYPDFTKTDVRAWWGAQQAALIDVGIDGIWNDMNEPASFLGGTLSELARFDDDGRGGSHDEFHNQYGTLMARSSYEGLRALRPALRPFVITRAAYPGVQRYSSIWTGDNRSTWEHMKISLPMVVSLGISGVPFAGADIGGFTGAPSGEMYGRWLQAALLFPFYRTHSAVDTPRREPWSFGAENEAANRVTIRLRYKLLPAIYTAFDQHVRDGRPVVRPVFWDTGADTLAFDTNDEYMLGDHLLAAPVTDSAADARSVYLPRGRWYRLGADSAYDGGRRVTVSAPFAPRAGADSTGLRGLPLFARAGAVIPMAPVMSWVGQRAIDTLALHVFPGSATSELYEDADDGYEYAQGHFRRTTFATSEPKGRLAIALARAGTFAGARTFAVTVHGVGRPRSVSVDGRRVTMSYDAAMRTTTFTAPSTARRIELVR